MSPLPLRPAQYTRLTGASGEFYVAAELTRRLWVASVTPQGVERTDVLAQHLETKRVIAIQVKTSSRRSYQFRLSKKLEEPTAVDNEWLILVSFDALGQRPAFYVMPRNVVAAYLWVDHRAWLARPNREGGAHRDTDQRAIRSNNVQAYLEQWDWLHQPATEIAYHLPDWFYEGLDRFGLPPGHPGVVPPS